MQDDRIVFLQVPAPPLLRFTVFAQSVQTFPSSSGASALFCCVLQALAYDDTGESRSTHKGVQSFVLLVATRTACHTWELHPRAKHQGDVDVQAEEKGHEKDVGNQQHGGSAQGDVFAFTLLQRFNLRPSSGSDTAKGLKLIDDVEVPGVHRSLTAGLALFPPRPDRGSDRAGCGVYCRLCRRSRAGMRYQSVHRERSVFF